MAGSQSLLCFREDLVARRDIPPEAGTLTAVLTRVLGANFL